MRTLLINCGPIVHLSSDDDVATRTVDNSVIEEGKAIIIEDGVIANIAPSQEVISEYGDNSGHHTIDVHGRAVIPGLIDAHAHLLWSGDRSQEVRWRLEGKTYRDISEMGGGIQSTVNATRASSSDELQKEGYVRLRSALRTGTTHMEVKSGYGLNTETELKLLEVASALSSDRNLPTLDPTWMGAHDTPKGMPHEAYIESLISEQLPSIVEQGIARSADVFCEPGWFSVEESEDILKESKSSGLDLRMHIDEFADSGGSQLAAELKVQTADHAYHTSLDDRLKMKAAGVITGFLPGTPYAMGDLWPNMSEIHKHEIPYTLATDFNPNCQTLSLPFMASLMVQRCKVQPLDALASMTVTAAKSSPHKNGVHGIIREGAIANLNILDSPHWESFSLKPSHTPFSATVLNGTFISH
ncbi:MAG: imidazolonepropionase [Candidatus Poseidoniales archaeon]|nr:MAG: imidazolonepropionase [Candidatus Poseidoniales archaeon]